MAIGPDRRSPGGAPAAPRGGFGELARASPPPAQAEAHLRLLNGVCAGGVEPKPGQPVKVVY